MRSPPGNREARRAGQAKGLHWYVATLLRLPVAAALLMLVFRYLQEKEPER